MFWIIHNGVVIDAVSSKDTAIAMAVDINKRFSHTKAVIRFLPVVATSGV